MDFWFQHFLMSYFTAKINDVQFDEEGDDNIMFDDDADAEDDAIDDVSSLRLILQPGVGLV